ncbi:hypothetical protein [Geomonas silvestris]|nr:hypothetical protein [Geomonas silvestris]
MPNVEKLLAATTRHQASYAGFLKGDAEMAKACEEDRLEVCKHIAQYRGIAKACSIVNPKVPAMLGFDSATEKTPSAAIILAEVRDVRVTYNNFGQPVVSFAKVQNAKGYQIWISDGDPSIESNWRLYESATVCKGIVIPGLNRALFHWLKVRALRGKQAGPWSAAISIPNS